jgi:hypothetical protein
MLLVATQVMESVRNGHGLFAAQDIRMGDPVWRFDTSTCLVISAKQQATLSSSSAVGGGALRADVERYAYPEPDGSCVLCLDDARFINHGGAAANVTLCPHDANVLSAARDIERGEEILEDYAEVYGRIRLANCAAFLASRSRQ